MDEFLRDLLVVLFILAILFVIYSIISYFRLKKTRKYFKQLQESLKKGDQVIFLGGVYGTIDRLTKTDAFIKISENNIIKVKRETISQKIK
ncbi:MAG: preprotein translocase subunit YajC [Tissierellia bacterium]|nr:preprotein translocase subunit YajC [Tissierellia bacterium]